ncbi:MAG: hypothetical protein U0271_08770 [Polyangiaceae bacterium]
MFPTYVVRTVGAQLSVTALADTQPRPGLVDVYRNGRYQQTRLELGPATLLFSLRRDAEAAALAFLEARNRLAHIFATQDSASLARVDVFYECTVAGDWGGEASDPAGPRARPAPAAFGLVQWCGGLALAVVAALGLKAALGGSRDAFFKKEHAEADARRDEQRERERAFIKTFEDLARKIPATDATVTETGALPKLDTVRLEKLSLVDRDALVGIFDKAGGARKAGSEPTHPKTIVEENCAWMSDLEQIVADRGGTKSAVLSLEWVGVVVTDHVERPVFIDAPTDKAEKGYTPGKFEGRVYILDLVKGEIAGARRFKADMPAEFTYRQRAGASGQSAVDSEFTRTIAREARAALGR